MIHIWRKLVDAIFPPSPSLLVLREHAHVPSEQYYEPLIISSVMVLSRYQSSFIRASITAGKFEHNQKALRNLGKLFYIHLTKNQTTFPPAQTIFVPIPLHPKRELERGYNQVVTILESAIAGSEYRIVPLLKRVTNTSPQSHLRRDERLGHLQGVFVYRTQKLDWDTVTTVILFDDVMTTGSTLKAARRALATHLPAHVTLYMISVAH